MPQYMKLSLSSEEDNQAKVEKIIDLVHEAGILHKSVDLLIELDNVPVFHIDFTHLDFDRDIFNDLAEDGPVEDAKEAAESQYEVSTHNLVDDSWGDGGYRDTQLHCIDLHIPIREVISDLNAKTQINFMQR